MINIFEKYNNINVVERCTFSSSVSPKSILNGIFSFPFFIKYAEIMRFMTTLVIEISAFILVHILIARVHTFQNHNRFQNHWGVEWFSHLTE